MNVFLILILHLTVPSSQLDELYARDVLSAAVLDEKCMFVTSARSQGRPIAEIHIYDFSTGAILTIDDGRVRPGVLTNVAALKNGFLLSDLTARTYYELEKSGAFKNLGRFDAVENLSGNTKLVMALPMDERRIAVTFRNLEAMEKLHLAIFDIETGIAVIEFSRVQEEFLSTYWVPRGDGWYQVTGETGAIQRQDEYFQKVATDLAKGSEPVTLVKEAQLRKLLIERGASPNAKLLDLPVIIDESTLVFRKRVFDETGLLEGSVIQALLLRDGVAKTLTDGQCPIGRFGNQWLVFDTREGGFSVTDSADF